MATVAQDRRLVFHAVRVEVRHRQIGDSCERSLGFLQGYLCCAQAVGIISLPEEEAFYGLAAGLDIPVHMRELAQDLIRDA